MNLNKTTIFALKKGCACLPPGTELAPKSKCGAPRKTSKHTDTHLNCEVLATPSIKAS